MLNKAAIKEAFDRKQKILESKPFIGKGSVTTNFKITDGTTCEITEGNIKLIADMSEQAGGNNQGPTPGTYGRAAFGSCLAISYMMIASQMEVQVDSLEIEVQVDYDARGMYYFDEVRSGYTEIRYHLKVQSPASEEKLQRIMEEVEKHSSYLDNFGNTVPIKPTVEVIKAKQMDPRLQLRVQRYGWDKAMPFYERGWKQALKPAQDLLVEMADLQEGQKVLDISCGTGIVTFQAAAAVGAGGAVTGIDISDKMVERCTQAATDMGFTNVDFQRMEAEALTLEDDTFDVALNALGLMYYLDPTTAMQETHRVVKPGGKVVSAVWGARKGCGWAEIFPIVDARVSTEVCPMFFILGTGDSLANLYEEVGFKKVETQRISTTIHYTSDEEALNASFAGGPVAMAYARFDEATKKSAHQEYLESIAQYKKEGEYYIPGEFVVVSGLKAL